MDSFFKKIYNLTKKIKQRSLLHFLGGGALGLIVNSLLLLINAHWTFAVILTYIVCWKLGDVWERFQVKEFGATYDDWDIRWGIFGGLVVCLLILAF